MENALVLQTANLMKTKKEIYSLPTEKKKHFFGVSYDFPIHKINLFRAGQAITSLSLMVFPCENPPYNT